jgi:hypothetical protein
MRQDERDRALLAIPEPADHAWLQAAVDDLIAEELPVADPTHLYAAASAFDLRGETLPIDEKLVAWQFAAALRLRATGGGTLH